MDAVSLLRTKQRLKRRQYRIGVGVTTFGMLFLVLGVMMFFDAALLALGDVSRKSWHVVALLVLTEVSV